MLGYEMHFASGFPRTPPKQPRVIPELAQDSSSGDGSGGGSSVAVPVGVSIGVVGALALLCAVVLLLWARRRRRRRSKAASAASTAKPRSGSAGSAELTPAARSVPAAHPAELSAKAEDGSAHAHDGAAALAAAGTPAAGAPRPEGLGTTDLHVAEQATQHGWQLTQRIVGTHTGTDASADTMSSFSYQQPLTAAEASKRDKVAAALQRMASASPAELFAGRYLLTGERVDGGQSVVQFARDSSGMFPYAIKCALSTSADCRQSRPTVPCWRRRPACRVLGVVGTKWPVKTTRL